MKNLLILLLVVTILVTSCGPDEKETPKVELTSAEASSKIVATGNLAADDVISMVESEGLDALTSFAELFSDFDQFSEREEQKSWVKKKFQIISQYFVNGPASRVAEGEFSFDDIKGVFNWNPEFESFERVDDSEFFIVNFPSEGSETNNAELKITDLQILTIPYSDEFETYDEEYPTVIDATLKVDGETYISISATASWSSEGFPEEASIDLLVSPFTFLLDFDDTGNLRTSGSASLSKDGSVIMSVSGAIDFGSEAKEEPSYLDGSVQYRNVKLSGTIDVAGYDENGFDDNGDPIEGFDGNEYIDLEVFVDDVKVGDISIEEDIFYIVYLDGTKEILEELLEGVIEDMEEAFEELEGEDDSEVID